MGHMGWTDTQVVVLITFISPHIICQGDNNRAFFIAVREVTLTRIRVTSLTAIRLLEN